LKGRDSTWIVNIVVNGLHDYDEGIQDVPYSQQHGDGGVESDLLCSLSGSESWKGEKED
jgi:hypothetical protein